MALTAWCEATLGDVCIKITDGAHQSPPSVANGLPMASVKDMTPYGINVDGTRRIAQVDFDKLVKQGCQPLQDDILIAKDGATALETVCHQKTQSDYVLLSSVAILRPNKDLIVPSFLNYYLKSPTTKNYIKTSFFGGAAIPRVILKHFNQAKINFPESKETQRKIAGVLLAYDDLIENNNKRIKILEEMAQKLYKEWFIDFRFPNNENTKFIESDLGKIPIGWEPVKLGAKVNILKGKNITKATITEGSVPVVAGGLSPAYYHNKANAKAPVITISASGANAGYINLYYEDIWASDCSYINEQTTPSVYFYYCFLQDRKIDVSRLQRGAAQPHVYPTDLMELYILNIPNKVMQNFNENIAPTFNLISNLKQKNANLMNTRNLLLPRLISGEVSVENLEIKA